jgi:cobalt-precorrin 5A hydrolase
LIKKKELLHILVPNPSDIVKKYEGTASVSEAASLISSSGNLIVPKQKFPPNLTVAVAKVNYQ